MARGLTGGAWLLAGAFVLSASPGALGEEPKPVAPPVLLRSFGSGEGNYRGSPVVADINGDRQPEIIVSVWNELQAWTASGKKLWGAPFHARNYSGAVIGDLDSDGLKEVVMGDNVGNVHVFDCAGKPKPGWPRKVNMDADIRAIACADVDADGADEVIVFSSLTDKGLQPNMYMFEGTGEVMKGFPHYVQGDPFLGGGYIQAGGFNCNLAVGDVTGDGKLEMVCCQDYGSVVIWQPTGEPVWIDNRFKPHSKLDRPHWGEVRAWPGSQYERVKWGQGSEFFMEFTYSPPCIADIDLDGTPEIIAVPNLESGQVGPFKGSALCVWNPDRTWKAGFDPAPKVTSAMTGEGTAAKGEANPVAVVGDIAGDARLEIAVAHVDGTVRAYDASGKELWSVKVLPSSDCAVSEPLVADVTGDGKGEVIVLSSNSVSKETELIVIDGQGNRRLSFKMPFHTLAAPTIADADGDGRPELTLCAFKPGEGKTVYVYRWDVLNPKAVWWCTGRGNFGHTACYGAKGAAGGPSGIAKYADRISWSAASKSLKVGVGVLPASGEGAKRQPARWLLAVSNTGKRKVVLPRDVKVVIDIGGRETTLIGLGSQEGAAAVEVEGEATLDLSELACFLKDALPAVPGESFKASLSLSGSMPAGTNPAALYLAPPETPFYWSGTLRTLTRSFSSSE